MTKKEFKKLVNKHLIIDQRQNTPFGKLHNYISGIDELYKAMNFTRCCKSDSELLICLDNGNYEMLTNYKLYPLVSESKGYYSLHDDDNKLVQMSKVRFKKVVAN